MENQIRPAELRFVQHGVSLYGAVMRMNQESLTVRLQSMPLDRGMLSPKIPVEMTVVARNEVYCAPARVLEERDGKLTLAFTAPVRQIERRNEKRIVFTTPVEFRAIHSRNRYGAWQTGMCADLSRGGLRLLIDSGMEMPKHLELLLALKNERQAAINVGGVEEANLATLDLDAEDRPIRIEARIAYQLLHPDGRGAVGLNFTRLNPSDQFQIIRFINGL